MLTIAEEDSCIWLCREYLKSETDQNSLSLNLSGH